MNGNGPIRVKPNEVGAPRDVESKVRRYRHLRPCTKDALADLFVVFLEITDGFRLGFLERPRFAWPPGYTFPRAGLLRLPKAATVWLIDASRPIA